MATFAALAALGPALATLRVVAPIVGFGLFGLGGAGCLFAGLGLLGVAAVRRRKALLAPAALAWLVALPLVTSAGKGGDAPPINDISTDLDDPPAITVVGRPILAKHDLDYPQAWKAIVREGYPGLTGRTLRLPRDEAFALVERAARAHEGWVLHRIDAASGVIEGSEETALFHFVDDFTVRVVGEREGARIDMRSRSRDGRGDLGVNARRIRGFLGTLAP